MFSGTQERYSLLCEYQSPVKVGNRMDKDNILKKQLLIEP